MNRFKLTTCILIVSAIMLTFTGCLMKSSTQTPAVPTKIDAKVIGVGAIQKQIKAALGTEFIDTVYDMEYQKCARKILDQYKEETNYTLENPLMVLNPFGTNRTGLYVYFETEKPANISYTISVEDESIPDFTADLYSNEDGTPIKEHEGHIIGLIQGMTNTLTLEVIDEKDRVTAKMEYTVDVPDFGTLDKLVFKTIDSGDLTKLSDGLFTLLDYDLQDAEEYSHILVVDHAGVIRAELVADGIKHAPVVEWIDGNMVFAYDNNNIASVNRLGQVERIYNLGQYLYHHDMEYNASNHSLAILADDTERDTIEELVITLNLYTGEVSMLLDFELLMNDIYQRATRPELNMTFGTEFDWIHFNSLAFLNATDVILSSRELSSLIRVNNVYQNPEITSILADELLWKDTAYADITYKKLGDFSSHAGQHNLNVIMDDSLEDGQYYITLFNNNWGNSPTWPEFDWSSMEGVNLDRNTPTQGNLESAWYKYLVDDTAKTFTLVDSVEVPYASFVSNAKQLDNGNIAFGAGSSTKVFGEYDSKGNPIVTFAYDSDSMVGAYRAMKFSYQGFWFN